MQEFRKQTEPRSLFFPAFLPSSFFSDLQRRVNMNRQRMILGLAALAIGLASLGVSADDKPPAGVAVDRDKRTVTIDAKIAPRKINDPRFKEIYPIEVIACWPFPKGQKAHETVVTIDVKPSVVHKALEDLGLKPGKPA